MVHGCKVGSQSGVGVWSRAQSDGLVHFGLEAVIARWIGPRNVGIEDVGHSP